MLETDFAAAMGRLGPFGSPPHLAVAVSGGADSTALAMLAQAWATAQGGDVLGLIVDHGLRAESAAEAAITAQRLQARGIASEILTLKGLGGSAIQAQARRARHEVLAAAAAAQGRLHLLLGHHVADQSETVAMRAARGPRGAEGIAGWAARDQVLLLRPLLAIRPDALREYLYARKMEWIEDPSNQAVKFERVRLRLAGVTALPGSAAARLEEEHTAAAFLAGHASLRPEGFAVLAADACSPAALAALVRVVGGAEYSPGREKMASLAARLRPATLGGVRICAAGRLGEGWLLTREPAACAAPVPAMPAARWDRRFELADDPDPGRHLGALGAGATKFRRMNSLPAVVLRGLPCLRDAGGNITFPVAAHFIPPAPACPLPFRA
jgi:tRNA(Ile)-lysidine synthase